MALKYHKLYFCHNSNIILLLDTNHFFKGLLSYLLHFYKGLLCC